MLHRYQCEMTGIQLQTWSQIDRNRMTDHFSITSPPTWYFLPDFLHLISSFHA